MSFSSSLALAPFAIALGILMRLAWRGRERSGCPIHCVCVPAHPSEVACQARGRLGPPLARGQSAGMGFHFIGLPRLMGSKVRHLQVPALTGVIMAIALTPGSAAADSGAKDSTR